MLRTTFKMLKTTCKMLKTTCKPFKYNGKSFFKYLLKCCKTFLSLAVPVAGFNPLTLVSEMIFQRIICIIIERLNVL